jgi:osmotically inducible lipoprotein OsmB
VAALIAGRIHSHTGSPFESDVRHKGGKMKTIRKYSVSAVAAAVLIGLGGCAGMSHQDKGTATGAVIGGVAGNVMGGGVLGTAAGAAVGGVVGHEVTKPK